MSNIFGKRFCISTFGESHGQSIGAIVNGCPIGLSINEAMLNQALARRKPGQSDMTTQRIEQDYCQILSGVFQGKTTGMPICLLISNQNAQPQDYQHLVNTFRPSHADFTYTKKYGIRDHCGGGRSSARETASWVAAGAIAQAWLLNQGVKIYAYTSQIGDIVVSNPYQSLFLEQIDHSIVRCPEKKTAHKMVQLIKQVKDKGDSIGGVVTGVITGLPIGLGEPIFDKFHACLGKAMLTINAVKGFEYGSGFAAASMYGTQHNDIFYADGDRIRTQTNFSGGVQGGITNGEDIYFRVAFKPPSTLMQPQKSIDQQGNSVDIQGLGRHDPCVVPRAVPIVEAMSALVAIDFWLLNSSIRN